MDSVRLLRESRITNEPCHTVSKLCLKPAQNSLCPFVKPKGGGACVSGAGGRYGDQRGRGKLCGAGGMGHRTGLLETGGDHTSIPKFRINIFQVPLEAVAFQPLPQLHSALYTVGRKCRRDTMEIMKVRLNAPKREAGRNQTFMHRQQTQEHQQLYFLLYFAWAWLVALISVSLEVSLGKTAWWHTAILTRSLEVGGWKVHGKVQSFRNY